MMQDGLRMGCDVEIKSYLRDAAGSRSLVFDLSITHDRIGSSCHVQQKVCHRIPRTLTPPCVSLRSANENLSSQPKFYDYHLVYYAYSNHSTVNTYYVGRVNDEVIRIFYKDA